MWSAPAGDSGQQLASRSISRINLTKPTSPALGTLLYSNSWHNGESSKVDIQFSSFAQVRNTRRSQKRQWLDALCQDQLAPRFEEVESLLELSKSATRVSRRLKEQLQATRAIASDSAG